MCARVCAVCVCLLVSACLRVFVCDCVCVFACVSACLRACVIVCIRCATLALPMTDNSAQVHCTPLLTACQHRFVDVVRVLLTSPSVDLSVGTAVSGSRVLRCRAVGRAGVLLVLMLFFFVLLLLSGRCCSAVRRRSI